MLNRCNKFAYIIIINVFCLFGLSACQTGANSNAQLSGAIPASYLFHDQINNITVSRGPLIEGMVGQEIDQLMDQGDRDNLLVAVIKQPLTTTSAWINSRRHIRYMVRPTAVDWTNQGYYCRSFQAVVLMSGEVKRGQGRLCKIHRDTWQAIAEPINAAPASAIAQY